MFRRRRPEPPAPPTNPDASLPLLSVQDAATLATLARRAFAERGLETLYDGAGTLVGADGHRFGLSNLSIAIARAPRQDWPGMIDEHASAMASTQRVVEPRSLDEARNLLLLRLCAGDQIPPDWSTQAIEVLPGIVVVAALDYPSHVSHLTRADALDPFGGWAAVEPVALGNLRRLPAPHHFSTQAGPEPDSTVHVFHSDDLFGASRFLVLDELLKATLLIERPANGVLVAVPNRHMLAVHVVTGVGVVEAMRGMLQLSTNQYEASAGPLSPHVYYRASDGHTQQVSRPGADGRLRVEITGRFHETWRTLGLLTDG
jgi:hypothetical protein